MRRKLLLTIQSILELLGAAVGTLLSFSPHTGSRIYGTLIAWNREQHDRITLLMHPFLTSLGKSIFDLRMPLLRRIKIQTGGLMELDLAEKTQRQIFSHKLFEAGVSRFVKATLHVGDVFVDVGANVGYFSVLAAPLVGTQGKVIAIEPEKKNFERLSYHAQLNGYSQIALYNCAVGDEEGMQTLHINPLNHGGNSLIPFRAYASGNERHSANEIRSQYSNEELFEEVQVRILDRIFEEQNISEIVILKIDVEGFEKPVIHGAVKAITSGMVEHVICEVNNDEGRSELFDLFTSRSYKAYRISFSGVPEPINSSVVRGNVLFSRYDRTTE